MPQQSYLDLFHVQKRVSYFPISQGHATTRSAPAPRGWGNILRRSTSIFENSPFLSGIANATTGGEVDRQDQKAIKIAFYNTAALVFVAVLFYTLTQVLIDTCSLWSEDSIGNFGQELSGCPERRI